VALERQTGDEYPTTKTRKSRKKNKLVEEKTEIVLEGGINAVRERAGVTRTQRSLVKFSKVDTSELENVVPNTPPKMGRVGGTKSWESLD